MITLLVIAFFATIVSGPAYEDWRARRREIADRPMARAYYLPTAACREPEPADSERESDVIAEHLHRQSECAMHSHCEIHDGPLPPTDQIAGQTTRFLRGGGTITTLHLTPEAHRALSISDTEDRR